MPTLMNTGPGLCQPWIGSDVVMIVIATVSHVVSVVEYFVHRVHHRVGTGSQNYKCQKYVISWLHNAGIAITSIIKQARRFYV